jgi:molybdenum cofactor biosynthesis protein MoaC
MYDISWKYDTLREASAQAKILLSKESIQAIKEGKVPKGDVISVARTAGIIAAKRTGEIIPLCHNIPVDHVSIDFELGENEMIIRSNVKTVWKTGVEMEALTAVAVASLTVYDMLKPIDENIIISEIKLLYKKGGKSDFKAELERKIRAGIVVISDSVSAGTREDRSGRVIEEELKKWNVEVVSYKILPDEMDQIEKELIRLADELKVDLILTTGGTGLGPRDVTPEATNKVIEKEVPGIIEAARMYGQRRTPLSMLSRAIAGVRKNTLIINMPGSPRAAREYMTVLFPAIFHAYLMLEGGGH